MTDSTLASDLLAYLDAEPNRVGDAMREAQVRRIIVEHQAAATTRAEQVMTDPTLNVLAGIEAALTRIAANTTRVPEHVPAEQALEKWPLRMHEELAVPYLRALGIEVDE